MADPERDEGGEFTVRDRRLFTPEGELRPGAKVESPPAETPLKKPSQEPPKAQAKTEESSKATRRGQPPQPEEPHGPVQFEHLMMSLITTAMLQMGLATRPGEIAPPPNLAAAQETIELLQVLQQKTKGNLTKEEEQVLTGGLYELRLAFVEMTRRAGRSR